MPQPASTQMNQIWSGLPVEIDRGEKADHDHEDAEVDDKSPHGAILRHGLNSLIAAS